jgi:hypothetical protein
MVFLVSTAAAKPGFGELYYDGRVVRTIVPPAAMPHAGVDNLYAVMDGASGQRAVAAVAPGAPGYHGGKWAFHAVTWNTTPYLLTSEADVQAAASKGDVTIARDGSKDVKCPIQP